MSASPLPLADMAGIAHVHAQRTDRVTAGLELALDAAALLFLPVLTMASLGTAPLAIVAEICALGLVLRRTEPARAVVPGNSARVAAAVGRAVGALVDPSAAHSRDRRPPRRAVCRGS